MGGFAIFVKSLRGDAKLAFESLKLQLGEANGLIDEHEERIEEIEGFARDDAEKIAELEEALLEEKNLKESIVETFTLDLAKMKDSRDHALNKLREFIGSNEELKNGHNELLKDHAQLEKSLKEISSELKTLRELLDTLLAKDLMNHYDNLSKDSNVNACATNPSCDKASLIEENTRLKAQLEKGLATCIQGEKNLNDLLSNQKGVVGKEGLGFAPKSKKANNNKKKPTPPH
jgi:chromosome segregation ATPase